MKMMLIVLISLAGFAEGVLNGKVVQFPQKYPFFVYIEITEVLFQDTQIRQTRINPCGGSLILKDVVLTGAHCLVYPVSRPEIAVSAGAVDRYNVQNLQDVVGSFARDFKIHEGFGEENVRLEDKQDFHNDIALVFLENELRLSDKVKLATLAVLTPDSDLDGVKAMIMGYGLTETGAESAVLLEGKLNVMTNSKCRQALPNNRDISDSEMCAVAKNKKVIGCIGDSGGPLVIRGMVAGLGSWTTSKIIRRKGKEEVTCDAALPTVFTKISAFIDWINRNKRTREDLVTEPLACLKEKCCVIM